MNPLCVAITAGAKDNELEQIIKDLEAMKPLSKGEQECLDAARLRQGSWVSQKEILAVLNEAEGFPPYAYERVKGFIDS